MGRRDRQVLRALLGLLILIVTVTAVDVYRWNTARYRTIAAVDSAVLAAGRQLRDGASPKDAIVSASQEYAKGIANRPDVLSDNIRFGIEDGVVEIQGQVAIKTYALWLIGLPTLPLLKVQDPSLSPASERLPPADGAEQTEERLSDIADPANAHGSVFQSVERFKNENAVIPILLAVWTIATASIAYVLERFRVPRRLAGLAAIVVTVSLTAMAVNYVRHDLNSTLLKAQRDLAGSSPTDHSATVHSATDHSPTDQMSPEDILAKVRKELRESEKGGK